MNIGITHYEGCWRSGEAAHLMCAMQCMKDILAILPDNFQTLFDKVSKEKNVLGFKIDGSNNKVIHIDYLRKTVSSESPF